MTLGIIPGIYPLISNTNKKNKKKTHQTRRVAACSSSYGCDVVRFKLPLHSDNRMQLFRKTKREDDSKLVTFFKNHPKLVISCISTL